MGNESTDSQMRLAQQALDIAAAATEAAAERGITRSHKQPQQGSGEFQAVLLSLVTELKTDSREHRATLQTVLIRLTEGDGRMERIELQGEATRDRLSAIESRIAVVEHTGDDTREHVRKVEMRLAAIEAGSASGIQKAIHNAVAAVKPTSDKIEKKKESGIGLIISNTALLKIVAVIGSVAVAAVGGYFALRQTQVQATSSSSPPPPPPAPAVKQ
jgi:hypothetical protein